MMGKRSSIGYELIKFTGCPHSWVSPVRCIGGMNMTWALYGTAGTFVADAKRKAQALIRQG